MVRDSGSRSEEEGKLLTRSSAILRGKEDNLVKDLKETTLSLEELGEKYGVSRQAIHAFSKKQEINRKPKGHQTEECHLCQKLIRISKKPHSEFISVHTIVKKIGGSRAQWRYHVRRLREQGLVSQKFGRFRSEIVEKAYAIYFTERLPIRAIGRKAGLRNFPSIIRQHRQLGWNVPPSLYDGRGRSRIRSEMHRRKKR
jgi:biotin operon repressor